MLICWNTLLTNVTLLFRQVLILASENIILVSPNINTTSPIPNDSSMQSLENTGIFDDAYDDREVGAEADLNNLETTMNVSPIPTTRIYKDHQQIIGDINSATQTRTMTKISEEHVMVWTLVNLPKGKRAIGTKWVYRNKKRERGIVVRNKARLVAQGYTQEEGIDYNEVFAHVARIKAIRLFLAYASFMGLIVYQMDVKSATLYGTIEEALYGTHQAPKAWYKTLSTYLLENGYRRGTIDKTLFNKKDRSDILLVQVYVDDIIFRSIKKSLCVEFEQMMHKRFQISSMGELTFFLGLQVQQKPDMTFSVCACARFQVTPKISHLHDVKKIFRYLKGQPKLGLWYPIDSPFDLEAFFDSDYARASLDRKSTTGGGAEAQTRFEAASKQSNDPPLSRVNTLGSGEDIAFLEKPKESTGFEEIIDFLNASYVQYALSVNPTIYTTCIEQFWTSAKVKMVNGERQIQALVDKQKVIIYETSIRSDLKLDDAEGIDCLPTAIIFAELERMGYENLSQKLTFYKA
ncbi:putative ribonuclease H-like domain-containing protein [Tanacetum coccineum]